MKKKTIRFLTSGLEWNRGYIGRLSREGFIYVVDQGRAIIMGFMRPGIRRLEVPARLGTKPVAEIGSDMFSDNVQLREATIPEGVERIGDRLFAHCDALESVCLPGSLEDRVGKATFKDCSALTKAVLGEGIRIIGDEMFAGCTSLMSIDLPASVQRIGNEAFRNCAALKTIRVHGQVTFGDRVFDGCGNVDVQMVSQRTDP